MNYDNKQLSGDVIPYIVLIQRAYITIKGYVVCNCGDVFKSWLYDILNIPRDIKQLITVNKSNTYIFIRDGNPPKKIRGL